MTEEETERILSEIALDPATRPREKLQALGMLRRLRQRPEQASEPSAPDPMADLDPEDELASRRARRVRDSDA